MNTNYLICTKKLHKTQYVHEKALKLQQQTKELDGRFSLDRQMAYC